MILADLDALPATLNTSQAAELLGISRDHLWALARAGDAPIEPLRLGRALRWPTARLAALLGIEPTCDNAAGCVPAALASTPSPEGKERDHRTPTP